MILPFSSSVSCLSLPIWPQLINLTNKFNDDELKLTEQNYEKLGCPFIVIQMILLNFSLPFCTIVASGLITKETSNSSNIISFLLLLIYSLIKSITYSCAIFSNKKYNIKIQFSCCLFLLILIPCLFAALIKLIKLSLKF